MVTIQIVMVTVMKEMTMNDQMKKALKETVDGILAMSKDELKAALEEHKDGDIAIFLKEMGTFSQPAMTNDQAIARVKAINPDSFAAFDSRHIKDGMYNSCYRVGIAIRDKDNKFTGGWTAGIGASWEDAFVDLAHQLEGVKHEKPKADSEVKAGDKVSS
jgi:hypothetical protein